jgi:hypothetical protein
MAIRLAAVGIATMATLSGLACGRATVPTSTSPGPGAPTQVLPLSRLYVLEMTGIPPEDTVVTFAVNRPRLIILRHGPPDNTVFVELEFPDSVFRVPGAPDSVTVVVRPRPGIYAVDIATTVVPARGATIRFKYPVHFSAPLDALRRYGTAGRYERALAVCDLVDGTNYALLPSRRPASDNLESNLRGPGSYVVAAPK